MKEKNGIVKIWISFLIFILIFLVNFGFKTNIGYTSMMWIILDGCVIVLAISMLIINKTPSNKKIIVSLIFGSLMFVAYWDISFVSVKVCITTFLCSLASFSIFDKYKDNSLKFFKTVTFKSVLEGIGIGIGVGIFLGTINLFLNSERPNLSNLSIKFPYFLTALSPAIYEEIAFRTFLYTYCIYLLKGKMNTKIEKFSCYFVMIVPHVMIHTPNQFIQYGLISGGISIIILATLFGLPFAIMQKKSGIASAMIAHGIVDIIRFCFFGIPH